MDKATILLIEDNPDDVELTLHAFQKNHMANEVVVAGDGAEGLDYLFGTGKYAGRDADVPPALILLDLQLPKIGGAGGPEQGPRGRADEADPGGHPDHLGRRGGHRQRL